MEKTVPDYEMYREEDTSYSVSKTARSRLSTSTPANRR